MDLKSSDSYLPSRLSLLSWWQTGSCLWWKGQAVLCSCINSQSKRNQERTHLSPAKQKVPGIITAVEDPTTVECPELQEFKFSHAPYSGRLTGSTK